VGRAATPASGKGERVRRRRRRSPASVQVWAERFRSFVIHVVCLTGLSEWLPSVLFGKVVRLGWPGPDPLFSKLHVFREIYMGFFF
jgi:hypothetical protein